MRIIAIDWSGAKVGATKKIWLAEAAASGELLRLETGRNREAIADHLSNEARRDDAMVVGLDFAFSFPAWFMESRGYTSTPALWAALARDGLADEWLKTCPAPMWGKPKRPKPAIDEHFRKTERAVGAIAGVGCKSVFQIGGAGAVGTGSLRGMPVLHRLHGAGFGVWPFTAQARATAVEIYPRLLTGPVKKSVRDCRREYLDRTEQQLGALNPSIKELASASEDAFDAAVSALVMARHADELARLPRRDDARTLIEGEIWRPGVAS